MPHVTVTPLAPDGTKHDHPITYNNAEASQDASTGLLTVVLHGRMADREVTVEFPREQYADWKQADDPAPAAQPARTTATAPKASMTPSVPHTGDKEQGGAR